MCWVTENSTSKGIAVPFLRSLSDVHQELDKKLKCSPQNDQSHTVSPKSQCGEPQASPLQILQQMLKAGSMKAVLVLNQRSPYDDFWNSHALVSGLTVNLEKNTSCCSGMSATGAILSPELSRG